MTGIDLPVVDSGCEGQGQKSERTPAAFSGPPWRRMSFSHGFVKGTGYSFESRPLFNAKKVAQWPMEPKAAQS